MATSLRDLFPLSVSSVDDVYDAKIVEKQTNRYQQLKDTFVNRFGAAPDFYARSPGRVNIIGEHVDYSGYSVLPMAIDRDVVIAVSLNKPGDNKIVVANVESEKYPDVEFEHNTSTVVDIDSTVLQWSNYFKGAYKAVFEKIDPNTFQPFRAVVDGSVPAGAGVSSSAAFVCAASLAVSTANSARLTNGDLIATAIKGEHYMGVQCGGMDQSISVMANSGNALLIHFYPALSADPIRFPVPPSDPSNTPVFVIANTLVVADKHKTAPTNYNLRVVETRLASALLAKHLGISDLPIGSSDVFTLRMVQDRFVEKEIEAGHLAAEYRDVTGKEQTVLAKLEAVVDAALHKEDYTLEEIAGILGISVDAIKEKYIGKIVIKADAFKLWKRAKHVFSESRRVFAFRDVCELKAPYSGNLLKDLGALMTESQDSCRDFFECSCPEIDELTTLARSLPGCYGSRLTGAGWGGCTVSLVAESHVDEFVKAVTEQYLFAKYQNLKDADAATLGDIVFASKPASGAMVVRF
ncbi:ribosomal protein S5 domain 2-type protein [Cladochytrium replicatum]|nr:ribosomal protein S5 domain 2-type protein [Cladochytrium replicatum]